VAPKPADCYVSLDYSNDLDELVFLFEQYGKAVGHVPFAFSNPRTDIHVWDSARDTPKLTKHFVIGPNVDVGTRQSIIAIIQSYWDCFYSEGVRFPILAFEFCIDTGDFPPICFRKPHYGLHEGKLVMTHIAVLLHNGWIGLCSGAWGSTIVLAAKPHQEHVLDILDFIWQMCVSYRRLNQAILAFKYPIPHCDDAINNFGDSAGRLFFISLDKRTDITRSLSVSATKKSSHFLDPTTRSTLSLSCLLGHTRLQPFIPP
jgi:hypothetical protein